MRDTDRHGHWIGDTLEPCRHVEAGGRDASPRKNMLFISHRFLYPPDRGEKIRGFNLIRHLSDSWNIHLGCMSDSPNDAQYVDFLRQFCADLACFNMDKGRKKLHALTKIKIGKPLLLDYYWDAKFQNWVNEKLNEIHIDVIYVYSTAMMKYVESIDHPNKFLDMQDVDSEKWAEYATKSPLFTRPIWSREARTMLAYERRATLACRQTFLVSEPECQRFRELAPECAELVSPLEMGVDLDYFSPAQNFPSPFSQRGPNLVFVGNMDYWPNTDAAIWFHDQILPLVRREFPTVQFHIVGANPPQQLKSLARDPGVHVTGRVPDVRPYVRHADVSVAPLRIARGIQNKVIEAMAMGKPVVTTTKVAGAIRAEPGRDLLVAEDADTFAAQIAEVLSGRYADIGLAARRAAEQGYAWRRTFARLDHFLEGATSLPAGSEAVP